VAIAYHFNDKDWLGGKNYFASLFGAVAAVSPPDIQMVLVIGHKTQTTLPQEFPWLEVLKTPLMDRMHPLWLVRQLCLRQFECDDLLAWFLKRHHIDILSHSGYLGSRSYIKALPWLYDFQFMHLPEYWTPKQIRWSEKRYSSACKFAKGIIVSSHDALKDLENFAPWCETPKHVLQFVSNPIDFKKLPSKQDILIRYQLPENYFHLPNQFWSNKNHKLAIDALVLLKKQGINATIACSGKPFDARQPQYFNELMVYCQQMGVHDRFKVLGVVPYVDLQGLMAHACAVINPSKFEGWSTSVEEAKTLQQRLILSDIAVHREQAPKEGLFFAIDDPLVFSRHLKRFIPPPPREFEINKISNEYSRRLKYFGEKYIEIINSIIYV
jgi:glycosyltransferase involved in cell wall biosynthesis